MAKLQQSSKTVIITALISAVSTIVVAYIAIIPQIHKGDTDKIARLRAERDSLQQSSAKPPLEKITISGRIRTTEGGQPLTNSEIYLFPADNSFLLPLDPTGKFVFEHVPARRYSWIVLHDNVSERGRRGIMDSDSSVVALGDATVEYHITKE
jgi:hypothetical protein